MVTKNKYSKLQAYIEDAIAACGYTIGKSRRINIHGFMRAYSIRGLSETTLREILSDDPGEPNGPTIAALATVLSRAKAVKVEPSFLMGLIDRPELSGFDEPDEPESPPDEWAVMGQEARHLLNRMLSLPVEVRSQIAPQLMQAMARDWEFLDETEIGRLKMLLRHDVRRRSLSLTRYSETVLGGMVPVDVLESIAAGEVPEVPLKRDQVAKLMEAMQTFDGRPLELGDFQCLRRLN